MLPSRGLARNPASALRYSLSSRTKPTRILSTRQFSQAQSQSSVLSRRGLSRASTSNLGLITPSISAVGYGTSGGIASGVFAQRSGAARNLSLWPFQSKPQTPQTTTTASESSAQSPLYETSSLSTPAEPMSNAAVLPPGETDLSQLPDDLLRGFDSQSFLDIPESIGYLGELGLDYGWGPTTCCQWLLEHVHVYTGLPWWGTIAAAAFIFRAVLFFPSLSASVHQARMQQLQGTPQFIKAKAEWDDAVRTRDQTAMMYAQAERRRVVKEADVSASRPFINFAMVPFSYGMFRLLRGMVDIPVPGMETGGLAWFTDLTVHDPLYILPCVSVGLAVLLFKQTQRTNVSPTIEPMQEMIMGGMKYAMPPVIFLGTAWLPAAVQFFFFVLSVSSLMQTQAILTPAFRVWAGLPPLLDRDAPKGGVIQYQSPTKRGIRASLEDGVNAATKTIKAATGTTDDKARWKKAKEYEDQRAEEERQKAQRRMDETRRRRAGRRS
ncbi:hypothetical protein F4801DRAFT_75989 [Xylaria longipes]|nr:hypothetical protein F4801DRAFT_75989 [Xylaria longipes]